MISEKRHDIILQELKKTNFLTLQELIERTGCSASTVRRDLSKLQQLGRLQRVHGGAMLNSKRNSEPVLSEKLSLNLKEKREIGKVAAQLIQDNDCIFMDAGSSTIEMIPFIKAKNIVVVTNGLTHVEKLLNQGIKTLMIGGEVKATTLATVGASALHTLGRYCFDKAFLGMNGIDLKYGFTTPDEKEALIKEKAIEQATQSYILLDQSKLDEVYFAHVPIGNHKVELIVSKQVKLHKHYAKYRDKYQFLGGES
ncbi:DeoR ramily regulatory protein [Staphylococcus petrasii]|uniref:DeoR ramily regulatory protein n=1 Tax=Staphylococcus petrasii TaxID=1276936 RepID=A0A380G3I5_9STAP|nr:DeoR/GlpR family DNA-binding transcription regulator [Staphylococcus petrasii]MCI2773684.1 DeoR/GlpR family DNA-binding transcription regulator [Staphylococcus petrasii]PNZ27981.1 DeoR family transcriptional regulator [Staphylococcus petrasii]PNZ80748.1 DeoR family transcriptional regulator [Staphylococcus petrasii]TGA82142.1 DeoR/GlpR transcriptional regulator [Staphylococcus petrasii]TGE12988.1 DeoR/GlpR transcriptional regulator [Staphylococcus petrasii]